MMTLVKAQALLNGNMTDLAEEFTRSSGFFDCGIHTDVIVGESSTHPVIESTTSATIKIKGKGTKPTSQIIGSRTSQIIGYEDYIEEDTAYYKGLESAVKQAKVRSAFGGKLKGLGHSRLSNIFDSNLDEGIADVSLASLVFDKDDSNLLVDLKGTSGSTYSVYVTEVTEGEGLNFITNNEGIVSAEAPEIERIQKDGGYMNAYVGGCFSNLGLRANTKFAVRRIAGVDSNGNNKTDLIDALRQMIIDSRCDISDLRLFMNGTIQLLLSDLINTTTLGNGGQISTIVQALDGAQVVKINYINNEG